MDFLQVEYLSKHFPVLDGTSASSGSDGTFCVFEDVTLKIKEGEFVTIIGHSGCGKSTLLNIIAGFDTPTKGVVILDNKEVTGAGLDRMVVFQSFALMPLYT